jgi:predicted amidohydrolase
LRALLAQLACRAGAVEQNLARLEDLLALHERIDLAVFPELFLQGYQPAKAAEAAFAAESDQIDRVRAAAARMRTAVIVGFVERLPGGALANSAACVTADGDLAGVARKTQLFGEVERSVFEPGGELVLLKLAGRNVAPLICFESEFPEPARALAIAGADLLVTIAANMKPYGPEQELACRARALENRVAHLYVNAVGSSGALEFAGGSAVIDHRGELLASAGGTEQALEVEVPARWQHVGSDIDYLKHLGVGRRVSVAVTQTGD